MSSNHRFSQDWNPTPHEAHLPTHSAPKRWRKRYIFIIIGVVVVLGAAGSVFWLSAHNKPAPAPATDTTKQASQQAAAVSDAPQTYKSSTLNIAFTYPGTWKVRENADKSQVMLTSPQVTYQKGGVSTSGVFTLKMRNGIVPQAMQTTLQNISAVKKSEVIAYAAPTDQQRAYTNLSFGGKGTNMSLLMVTGGADFNVGDSFNSLDMQGAFYLFAGGYGSDPNDTLTFDSLPVGTFTGTAVYQQAVNIIESIKVY